MSRTSWDNSRCKGIWLHRMSISRQWPDAVEERCEICGKAKVFKVFDGKADNLEYIAWHIRLALPRNHKLFSHEYPGR